MKKTAAVFPLVPLLLSALVLGAALDGCKPSRPSEAGAHQHQDLPPHGGTAVTLGDDAFHIEFVRDPEAGMLSAYVLDDEMEEFVRGGSPGFTVVARSGGEEHTLEFTPVADASTGETATSTSLYTVAAPWLKTTAEFDGVIQSISIHGRVFTDTAFNFPRGNEKN